MKNLTLYHHLHQKHLLVGSDSGRILTPQESGRQSGCKARRRKFQGSCMFTCSEGSLADSSDTILVSLQQKHPLSHPDSITTPPPEDQPILSAIDSEVAQAIYSFPNGSASVSDSLQLHHFKDLIGEIAKVGSPVLLRILTPLVNLIFEGEAPRSVCPLFFFWCQASCIAEEGWGEIHCCWLYSLLPCS